MSNVNKIRVNGQTHLLEDQSWRDSGMREKVNEHEEKLSDLALKIGDLETDKASVEISDSNDRLVEAKVNALIDAFKDLVTKVVFWTGVPYVIPNELKEPLKLDAHNTRSFAYGMTFPLTLN